MESHFEQTAKQAAVEAVERRWTAKQTAAKIAAKKRRVKWVIALVGVLIVALVVGGIKLQQAGLSFTALADSLTRPFIGLTNKECARIDLFLSELQSFATDDIRPWKSAPKDVQPKRASNGLTYRMLIETRSGHCGLYEMVANGKGKLSIRELNPLSPPVKVTMADFNRARRNGSVYLIAVKGKTYVCGSDNPEDGREFSRRMGAYGRMD